MIYYLQFAEDFTTITFYNVFHTNMQHYIRKPDYY